MNIYVLGPSQRHEVSKVIVDTVLVDVVHDATIWQRSIGALPDDLRVGHPPALGFVPVAKIPRFVDSHGDTADRQIVLIPPPGLVASGIGGNRPLDTFVPRHQPSPEARGVRLMADRVPVACHARLSSRGQAARRAVVSLGAGNPGSAQVELRAAGVAWNVSAGSCTHSSYCTSSGTTCMVATSLGRRSIGIDLSAEYLDLAVKRNLQLALELAP